MIRIDWNRLLEHYVVFGFCRLLTQIGKETRRVEVWPGEYREMPYFGLRIRFYSTLQVPSDGKIPWHRCWKRPRIYSDSI